MTHLCTAECAHHVGINVCQYVLALQHDVSWHMGF